MIEIIVSKQDVIKMIANQLEVDVNSVNVLFDNEVVSDKSVKPLPPFPPPCRRIRECPDMDMKCPCCESSLEYYGGILKLFKRKRRCINYEQCGWDEEVPNSGWNIHTGGTRDYKWPR